MTEKDDMQAELDRLLDRARAEPVPEPGADLYARILTDAEAALPAPPDAEEPRAAGPGVMATLLRAIGGWPALGGLAAAACAGLWIGISQPEGLGVGTSVLLDTAGLGSVSESWSLDPVEGFDLALMEN